MEIRLLIVESIVAVALLIVGIWFAFKDWFCAKILKYVETRLAYCKGVANRCFMNKEPIPNSIQHEVVRLYNILDKLNERY